MYNLNYSLHLLLAFLVCLRHTPQPSLLALGTQGTPTLVQVCLVCFNLLTLTLCTLMFHPDIKDLLLAV